MQAAPDTAPDQEFDALVEHLQALQRLQGCSLVVAWWS